VAQPVIDYTAKDFAGFESALLAYASVAMPSWTTQQTGDFGMLMLNMVSYVGDVLSYYEDRISAEAYLSTATLPQSVVQLAALLGYTPAPALAATTTVTLVSDPTTLDAITVPAGTGVITAFQAILDGVIQFELDAAVSVPPAGGSVNAAVTQGVTAGTTALTAANGTSYMVVNLGTSDGSAEQQFTLPTAPLLIGTLNVLVQLPSGAVLWTQVPSVLDAGPSDTVYSAATDAAGATVLSFGDDVNGAIPPSGCVVSAAYRTGGGSYGNVGANTLIDISTAVTGVSVASSLAATGGADAESLASIRTNAPRAWRVQSRCITAQDYADAALAIPAIDKASASAGAMGAVTVYVMAAAAQTPTATLIAQAQVLVASQGAAGSTVTVAAGTAIPVNIGSASSPVLLTVQPTFDRASVQTAVTQALQLMLSPAATDLGMVIPLSAVYSTIDQVPGVSMVSIPVFARSDMAQTSNYDQYFRAWELPTPGTIIINASGGS